MKQNYLFVMLSQLIFVNPVFSNEADLTMKTNSEDNPEQTAVVKHRHYKKHFDEHEVKAVGIGEAVSHSKTKYGERQHSELAHSEEANAIALNSTQIKLANISIEKLKPRIVNYHVYAPGEIKVNGYDSYIVSPRVVSVVMKRHVVLGEQVTKGQVLVTLFSESVAEAQAAYQVSYAEWGRVKKLGRKIIDDKHYLNARAEFDVAYGRLKAIGLSEKVIQNTPRQRANLGEYQLVAKINGSVLSDNFHQGQRVEAGDALIKLADEENLWLEANLPPNQNLSISAGTIAEVKVNNKLYEAEVIQSSHTIETRTRTRVIRLAIHNPSHSLHPGMFADVYFTFKSIKPILAVPESALIRSDDGDWVIFIAKQGGLFEAKEIKMGRPFGQWREISDIPLGIDIVTRGAFFIKAQGAKSGFDPHNH